MFRYLFKRDTILATIMVFAVMGLLSLVPLNTHVLDPIKMALQDFDYNDLAYSKFNKNDHTGVDTNIVIINIEDADRAQIAAMINKVVGYAPAAVAVDVLFTAPKDPVADSMLTYLFSTRDDIVLAYDLSIKNGQATPTGFLYPVAKRKGYANFIGEEGGTIRYFNSIVQKDTVVFASLATQVINIKGAEGYQSQSYAHARSINYTRTADKYIILSGSDLLRGETGGVSLFNKTVLLGYISADPNNTEDKHFTPLNKKSVGKSLPDMPGVIVHANILSMIESGLYITQWPAWLVWTLAVLLCWLHMALFIRYFIDKHIWFHLVAKIAQVLSAILIVYLGLLCFYKWDIKINLTPAFVAIILAVDVLYFYEALVAWLHKKFGFHSLFVHHAH